MTPLIGFVVVYLAVTVAIGLWAARRVHDSKDFLVAGRHLPLYMSVATVFATWFGAETVLAVSSTFLKEGLRGIVADPFGFSLCLILVGVFFARAFYRMDLLTIGDFYRKRYGKAAELVTSLCITLSYLGWTSAQMIALGLVFNMLSGGAIPMTAGIMIGAGCVLVYTLFGGMWSVAFTDIFQTVIIVAGLLYLAWLLAGMAGGAGAVIAHAAAAGKFEFWPRPEAKEMLAFLAAFLTAAIGGIPQQDVFQRVTSAQDEKTAVRASLLGGVFYFLAAFVPVFLAYSAFLIAPEMVKPLLEAEDNRFQEILPTLILERTPLLAQVMFFGALLSAILSTASGALLAPTALFTENVLRRLYPHMSDRQFLLTLRLVLVIFTLAVVTFALTSDASIYQMVQNTYKVTLVSCIVPLTAGVFWHRATAQGALLAITLGLSSWIGMEIYAPDGVLPPQLVGLAFSIAGMIGGSYASRAPHHAAVAFAAVALAAPAAAQVVQTEEESFRVVTVTERLEHPWGLAFLPDGRMLVTERAGRLRIVGRDGKLAPQPVAGLPPIEPYGQGGLLDVALHPRFDQNGLVYLSYAERGDGGYGTAALRGRLAGPMENARLENVEVIYRQLPKSRAGRHFGSRIVFDRAGFLYLTQGDRGEQERAQKLDDLAGKVVRLHDDGRVPKDNPLVSQPAARPEIFTLGNRNVQGAALHPATGELWSHEHGPQGGDEVNVLRAGANYGWPVITYGVNYGTGTKIGEGRSKPGLAQPVHYWVPSIAPSGMAFYTGERFIRWKDDLFVGALRDQLLVRLRLDGEKVVKEERMLQGVLGRIRDVRQGPEGFLYLLVDSSSGAIVRLEPAR